MSGSAPLYAALLEVMTSSSCASMQHGMLMLSLCRNGDHPVPVSAALWVQLWEANQTAAAHLAALSASIAMHVPGAKDDCARIATLLGTALTSPNYAGAKMRPGSSPTTRSRRVRNEASFSKAAKLMNNDTVRAEAEAAREALAIDGSGKKIRSKRGGKRRRGRRGSLVGTGDAAIALPPSMGAEARDTKHAGAEVCATKDAPAQETPCTLLQPQTFSTSESFTTFPAETHTDNTEPDLVPAKKDRSRKRCKRSLAETSTDHVSQADTCSGAAEAARVDARTSVTPGAPVDNQSEAPLQAVPVPTKDQEPCDEGKVQIPRIGPECVSEGRRETGPDSPDAKRKRKRGTHGNEETEPTQNIHNEGATDMPTKCALLESVTTTPLGEGQVSMNTKEGQVTVNAKGTIDLTDTAVSVGESARVTFSEVVQEHAPLPAKAAPKRPAKPASSPADDLLRQAKMAYKAAKRAAKAEAKALAGKNARESSLCASSPSGPQSAVRTGDACAQANDESATTTPATPPTDASKAIAQARESCFPAQQNPREACAADVASMTPTSHRRRQIIAEFAYQKS